MKLFKSMIQRLAPVTSILMASLATTGAATSNELASVPVATNTTTEFYLLIGQSNMAGRGKFEEGDAFPKDRVFILNDKDLFVPIYSYPFVNHFSTIRKSAAQISPGYMFAKTLLAAHPEKPVYLVSNARGGTSIEEWKKGTHYFNEAVRRTKEAQKQGQLKGILWHQGETDYRIVMKHKGEEQKYMEAYFATLRQFITDLRAELGTPDVPFIAGQVNRDYVLLNERLLKLPAELAHTYVVSSEGLTTVDGLHFDRPSVFELGKRYATKLLEVTAPDTPAR
jgi:hypothetical protein